MSREFQQSQHYVFVTKLIKYLFSQDFSCLYVADADLHGDVDAPELSGDDRSIASDIQDTTEAHLDNDSMDSDREALNLVSNLHSIAFILFKRIFSCFFVVYSYRLLIIKTGLFCYFYNNVIA